MGCLRGIWLANVIFIWLTRSRTLGNEVLNVDVDTRRQIADEESQHIYRLDRTSNLRRFDGVDYEELKIFCYNGSGPDIAHFWSSVEMRLKISSDNYHIYEGSNSSAVAELHYKHKATWFYTGLPWRSKYIKMNPFSATCVGVLTRDEFSVHLFKYRINYVQVLMTLAGLALFYYAPSLCRNVFFHYTTGVAAGVMLSLMLVSYLIHRKFNLGYWAFGCYSLSMYFLTSIWYNIKTYLVQNHVYVLGYIVVSGFISFAVCYRMGPVENPRSLNLIQWTLQLVGLLLIYLSSYYQHAGFGMSVAILLYALIPSGVKTQATVKYHKWFSKPKIRLLSEAEYLDQSRIETEKALKSLREYCQSPKCNAWKVTSTLKSPSRFAEFVEGSSHLTQEEVMDFSQVEFDDDYRASFEGTNGEDRAHLTDDNSSDETVE